MEKEISGIKDEKSKTEKILELLDLYVEEKDFEKAENIIQKIQKQGDELKSAEALVYRCRILLLNKKLDECKKLCNQLLPVLEKYDDKSYISRVWGDIAHIHLYKFEYDRAVNNYNKALTIAKESENYVILARSLHYLGFIYIKIGQFDKALEYSLEALKAHEKTGRKKELARTINNISSIYIEEKAYQKALKYTLESLSLRKEIEDEKGIALALTTTGLVYQSMNQPDTALSYYTESLKIKQKLNIKDEIPSSLNGIASVYLYNFKQYDKAIEYYHKSLKTTEQLKEKWHRIYALNGLAETYIRLQQPEKAEPYLNEAFSIARSTEVKKEFLDIYLTAIRMDSAMNNYQEAFEYHKKYIVLRDSLYNNEKSQQMTLLQSAYDLEMKDQELALQKSRLENQTFQKNIFISASILFVFLAIGLVYNIWQKQKTNQLLKEQSQEIITQNEELQQKQEEIGAQRDFIASQNEELSKQNQLVKQSIKSARTIQDATLPLNERLKAAFSDFSVLYKPKDVVSGDFYWLHKFEDEVMIVVADCTGHGVPGAFMSLIGSFILNDIIRTKNITDPAHILNILHKQVRFSLKQEITDNNNGMDATVCKIKTMSEGKFQLTFSGAKHTMYYVNSKKDQLQFIKGTRKSIGGIQNESIDFENHTVELEKDSIIYLCTDGYIDQNNFKRKKFGEARFQELLLKNSSLCLSQQKQILESVIMDFMKKTHQRDDITVLALKP